ncbi:Phosphoric monoester hydrolase, partial [Sarracenia purpurea var. burkii]
WGPHAYFQMLAESRNGTQSSSNSTNYLITRPTELSDVYIQSHQSMAISELDARDTNPILDGMESGRRN